MKKLCTIILLVLSSVLYAQNETITGTLLDDAGSPLIGATVLVKGTSTGAISDFDGNFNINVPSPVDAKVLTISFLGYESKEIEIGTQRQFKIILKPDLQGLDEVVVVGYGTVKKSDLTGSVSSVKSEEITKMGAISFDQALAGRAAGVVVQQSSGQPGGGAAIRIRAVSSLNGSDPLYVVDGIPMDNTTSSGLGNQDVESASLSPLAMINPADIESIEILKDASSTAIYGSRGANGVILITTKSGKSGKGVVSVEHDFGLLEVPNFIGVLNSNEYYILRQEAFVNAGAVLGNDALVRLDSARAGLIPSSDWQRTIIGTGTQSNTNIGFSGGNEDVRYLISSNIFDAKGVVDRTNYKRIATRANINANMSERFVVGLTMNYSHVTSDQRAINTGVNNLRGATNAITRALRAAPTTGLAADDDDEGIDGWTPVTALEANEYNNLLTQFIGSMFAEYELVNGLKLKTQFTYQNRNTAQRYYQYNILPDNVAEGGRARTGDTRNLRSTITNTINYNKSFKSGHNINTVLGQSIESTESESIRVSNYGFANDLLTYYDPGSATFYDPDIVRYSDTKLASFFGRVNYNYKGKYLLTLTGRYDGSSKFAANNKWAFFPAAALAYNVAKENFLKDVDAISELKLRVSYGTSGNQAISPYQSLDQYASSITPFNEVTTSIYYQSQLPNPNLTWETTTQFDAGLDLGLIQNKFRATLEYYEKTTDDLLFTGNRIPVQSGQSTYTENFGSLETKGFEASLTARIISNDKVTWTLNGNISTGKTKVKDMASDNIFSGWDPGFISGGTQRLIIGEEIGTFFGYKTAGIAQFDDFVEFQGLSNQERIDLYNSDPVAAYTFVDGYSGGYAFTDGTQRPGEQLYEDVPDANGETDGEITADDRTIIGQAQPDITFGINNSFTFGNLDFSFFIDSQLGKDVANIDNIGLLQFNGNQALTQTLDRWTPENPSNIWPRMDQGNIRTPFSDRIVEDASFVRLQNVTIGYSLPKELTDRLKISGLRVYISGTNLAMWTDYTGFNPDVSVRGSATTNLGHDNGGYPAARVIRLGANLKF